MKTLGKHTGRGFRSLYELTFPRSGRKLRVEATSEHLERITGNADTKGVPCIARWLADGEIKWTCHV